MAIRSTTEENGDQVKSDNGGPLIRQTDLLFE